MAEIKTDCFGYDKPSKRCKIMTEVVCKNRNCTFYKTWEQFRADMDKYPFGGMFGKKDEQGK